MGFSHDTSYKIPEGAKITLEKGTIIKISSIDKERRKKEIQKKEIEKERRTEGRKEGAQREGGWGE